MLSMLARSAPRCSLVARCFSSDSAREKLRVLTTKSFVYAARDHPKTLVYVCALEASATFEVTVNEGAAVVDWPKVLQRELGLDFLPGVIKGLRDLDVVNFKHPVDSADGHVEDTDGADTVDAEEETSTMATSTGRHESDTTSTTFPCETTNAASLRVEKDGESVLLQAGANVYDAYADAFFKQLCQ
ncbi:hypothetical protein SDRG_06199 [Saprolegnia diclina VS20]|uniref:Uncharacterized protein n=1 Tax=Saprolegnia diclina (strain VS20) TaxID=1156394 RepID=T0QQC6_SAPDV|nr:hypothetical protein SDRG_06199 [Saprolegnia diclina VS20]EQC36080.1 hypothetical protein SDRG_06199 [Saprolegnia diclina VS20]|eukprot:XP_008610186.1 hypothetical protein SDRG_06199 [Saprolegnia diclina VS20]